MEALTTKFAQLKTLCSEYLAQFATEPVKFKDAKLNDGTIVRFPNEAVVKGDAVTVVTEQGEMPLPDSQPDSPYILEDGTSFTVVNGVVDVITEATPEEETPSEEPAPVAEEKPELEKTPKRVIRSQVEEHVFNEVETFECKIDQAELFKTSCNEMKAEFSGLLKPLIDKIADLETKLQKQSEINVELSAAIELVGDLPSNESVTKSKPKEVKFEDMTPAQQFLFLRNQSK